MIREDRELLAELALLNGDTPALALRVIDGSASVVEQEDYAQRLISAGRRLQRRADEMRCAVCVLPSCDGLAGESPAGVVAKQPRS